MNAGPERSVEVRSYWAFSIYTGLIAFAGNLVHAQTNEWNDRIQLLEYAIPPPPPPRLSQQARKIQDAHCALRKLKADKLKSSKAKKLTT